MTYGLVLAIRLLMPVSVASVEEGLLGPPSTSQESADCLGASNRTATFDDQQLEAAIRNALALDLVQNLTCHLAAGLVSLTAEDAGIRSLSGIHNLTGLRELRLDLNPISDLGPLSSVTGLEVLGLWGAEVSDISPLADLTELKTLVLGNNSLQDIGPLAHLKALRDLNITNNRVSDIGPLGGLSDIAVLRVYNNPISDIGALRTLTNLTELHIHDLPELSDITPLLENEGLGPGDRVILMRSGVGCRDAAALSAKGVSVNSGCLAGVPIRWWGLVATALAVLLATGASARRARGRSTAAVQSH